MINVIYCSDCQTKIDTSKPDSIVTYEIRDPWGNRIAYVCESCNDDAHERRSESVA